MQTIYFNKIDEKIYKETLKNNMNVYLYPTKKTKNFYITITVKVGGNAQEYIIDGKTKKVISGVPHFLEHKVMNFNNKKKLNNIVNDLGLYANAYTSYKVTNYNIYGSSDIYKSLSILLDLFYNPKINKKDIENEKGIITSELNMYKNDPAYRIYEKLVNNIFKNSYLNKILVGEKEDIESITLENIKSFYNDFYKSDETFITVLGDFDVKKVLDIINKYLKNIEINKSKTKIIYSKEEKEVNVSYMLNYDNITVPNLKYSFKISKENIKIEKIKARYYLNFLMSIMFSSSSKLYEKYMKKKLAINMSYSITDSNDYVLITLSFKTKNYKKLLENLKKDINFLDIKKQDFERKKKRFISNFITSFEDIEEIENMIVTHITEFNKIINNSLEILNEMNYKEFISELKKIDFTNTSVLVTLPKSLNKES